MTRQFRVLVAITALAFSAYRANAQTLGYPSGQTQQPAAQSAASSASSSIPPDQQPTKEQLARLFEAMHLREQTESLLKMMPALIQQQLQEQMKEISADLPEGTHLTAQQQTGLQKIVNSYMQKELSAYSADDMLGDMASIYQRHFSRTDVDAYIVFYSTSPGQHLLAEQPAIMKEYMPLVMHRFQSTTEQITLEMAKEVEDYLKSSTPTGSAPASPKQ